MWRCTWQPQETHLPHQTWQVLQRRYWSCILFWTRGRRITFPSLCDCGFCCGTVLRGRRGPSFSTQLNSTQLNSTQVNSTHSHPHCTPHSRSDTHNSHFLSVSLFSFLSLSLSLPLSLLFLSLSLSPFLFILSSLFSFLSSLFISVLQILISLLEIQSPRSLLPSGSVFS